MPEMSPHQQRCRLRDLKAMRAQLRNQIAEIRTLVDATHPLAVEDREALRSQLYADLLHYRRLMALTHRARVVKYTAMSPTAAARLKGGTP